MNMFISNGERVLAALATTGAALVAWGGLLVWGVGADRASLWFMVTCHGVGLIAYTASISFLPKAAADEAARRGPEGGTGVHGEF